MMKRTFTNFNIFAPQLGDPSEPRIPDTSNNKRSMTFMLYKVQDFTPIIGWEDDEGFLSFCPLYPLNPR